jgi:phosphate transport system permease protein
MSAGIQALRAEPAAPGRPLGRLKGRRRVFDYIATGAMGTALLIAVVTLGLVVWYVAHKGAAVVNGDFLTKPIPLSRVEGPGMGPAVLGTLLITGAATLMAVPLGILGAIYLNEYGAGTRLAGVIRTMANVMTGVPSIVMGLFIYTIWVLRFGLSGFAGALALAALMLPIVIRTAEEMLRLVPDTLRQASYGLGARKSSTILRVVLPAALPGLTSGSLLAVARAAGETAPLLFTIGIVSKNNPNLFQGTNTALSVQIFRNIQFPFAGAQGRAWGAALTLIGIVFVLTTSARFIASRYASKR